MSDPTIITPEELSKADRDLLDLMIREAGLYQQGQLTHLLGSDARSVGLLSAATGLIAATVALLLSQQKLNLPLAWGGVGFAVCLFASSYNAMRSIWPSRIYMPGLSPHNFKGALDSRTTYDEILRDHVRHMQRNITYTRSRMEEISRPTRYAVVFLALSPLIAIGSAVTSLGHQWSYVGSSILLLAFVALGRASYLIRHPTWTRLKGHYPDGSYLSSGPASYTNRPGLLPASRGLAKAKPIFAMAVLKRAVLAVRVRVVDRYRKLAHQSVTPEH